MDGGGSEGGGGTGGGGDGGGDGGGGDGGLGGRGGGDGGGGLGGGCGGGGLGSISKTITSILPIPSMAVTFSDLHIEMQEVPQPTRSLACVSSLAMIASAVASSLA